MSASRFDAVPILGVEIFPKKIFQFLKGNFFEIVVKIRMARVGDDI